MINQVTLFGSIVDKEIELRYSKSEIPVIEFRIIHKNNKVKNPLFIDIEVWGTHAQNIVNDLQYGTKVVVSGQLRLDTWEKDGIKRSKIKITGDRIIIVGHKTFQQPQDTQDDIQEQDKAF